MLIYGIKKLKLAGLRLERFDPEYSPLIPGYYCVGVNMHAKVHDAIKGVPKIVTWDQSLLTVEIKHYNTGGCHRRWPLLNPVIKLTRTLRSIVTDHYLLDPDR